MYYTGLDPITMKPVYVAKSYHEKAMQRALVQYRNPDNYDLVRKALEKAGRCDLIGYGAKCLIRPEKKTGRKTDKQAGSKAEQGIARGRKGSGEKVRGSSKHSHDKDNAKHDNKKGNYKNRKKLVK